MLSRVDARDLLEWQAEYNLTPWGEARADLSAGMLGARILNAFGVKPTANPIDFVPNFDGDSQQQPECDEDLKSTLRAIAASRGV